MADRQESCLTIHTLCDILRLQTTNKTRRFATIFS